MNFTFTAAIQTTAKSPQPCGVQLTDMLPLCLIQILSLVANALAALAIWRLPGLETNKNHLVVRTLIISDLLIPLPMLPFSIASYLSCGWLGGAVACDVTAFLSTTLLSWSVFIVFVLCLLRFVAVKHPLWYRHNVTYTKVKIALFVTLLWACLHLVLPSVGVGKFRLYEKGFYCALDLTPVQPRERVLVYLVLVEGVVSTALLFYSGAVIISALFRRKRRVSQQLSPSHSRRLSTVQLVSRYHEEFATLTVVIVVLFCVCYGPFLLYRFLILVLGPSAFQDNAYYYTELLAHLSPLLNPVVYVVCNKQYRACVTRLLAKCCAEHRCIRGVMQTYSLESNRQSLELRKVSAIYKRSERFTSNSRAPHVRQQDTDIPTPVQSAPEWNSPPSHV